MKKIIITLVFSLAFVFGSQAQRGGKFYKERKSKRTLNGTNLRLTNTFYADGTVGFGHRGKLRKALGLTDAPSNIHAHHIIPHAFKENRIVVLAAKSKRLFNINEPMNGVALPAKLHLSGHNRYNDKIGFLLQHASNDYNEEQAYEFIEELINHIKQVIDQNPKKTLGQIAKFL